MRISAAEERSIDLNRQVEGGLLGELPGIEVSAEDPGRHDGLPVRPVRADPHRPQERGDGYDEALAEGGLAFTEVEELEIGLDEIVREQALTGNDPRPAPTPGQSSRMSTASVSPGAAPSIRIGPVSGYSRSSSSATSVSAGECGVI